MKLQAVLAAFLVGILVAWLFGWVDAEPAWKYLFAFVCGWNVNALVRWWRGERR